MKNRQKYLQRLYAMLLLAVMSISVLPVKLLHRHEGERLPMSRDFAAAEHFAAGHQPFCPICSCTFTQHYPPSVSTRSFIQSFSVSYSTPLYAIYIPGVLLSRPLRGPPAC